MAAFGYELYEINSAITELIDPETGEITDFDALEKLQLSKTEKYEQIALVIKNYRAFAAECKAEKQSLAEKQSNAENRADALQKLLESELAGSNFKTAKVTCSFRKTESVEVADVYKIPDEFLKYSEPTADKTAIKAAIKSGKEIEGAKLVSGLSFSVK